MRMSEPFATKRSFYFSSILSSNMAAPATAHNFVYYMAADIGNILQSAGQLPALTPDPFYLPVVPLF